MSLRIEQFGHVRRITLASPAQRNVLTAALAEDLLREMAQAEADPETRAVLMDADDPVFCGGAEASPPLPDDFYTFGQRMMKPVVVSVQGVAISAGVALVANAHIAVAAQGSSFGVTGIRDGHSDARELAAVSKAVGHRRALELALTGRIFTATEALSLGLVHAVAPAFELDDRATSIATSLANFSPNATRGFLEYRHRHCGEF